MNRSSHDTGSVAGGSTPQPDTPANAPHPVRGRDEPATATPRPGGTAAGERRLRPGHIGAGLDLLAPLPVRAEGRR